MHADLSALLDELYADGSARDAAEPDRLRRRRNLEPATARLIWSLVGVSAARDIIEIGTSNGYSAIWLADAATATGGRVISVDVAADPSAKENLTRAGLSDVVEFLRVDGGAYLAGLADASVDLLFLDAERVEYPAWWPNPIRVLRKGGILAIDNVLSHPDEVAPFLRLLSDADIPGETIEIGKGLHLAWRL